MVFSIKDVTPEMLPTSDDYVPDEPFKSYVFNLDPKEFRNETIEQLYGPFEYAKKQLPYVPYTSNNYVSPRSPSITTTTNNTAPAHPVARKESIALQLRQKQIDELKRHIAEKESKMTAAKNILTKKIEVESDRDMEKHKLREKIMKKRGIPEPLTARQLLRALPEVGTSSKSIARAVAAVEAAVKPPAVSTRSTRSTRSTAPATPIIIIDDSDVDMELGSDEDDVVESNTGNETENSEMDISTGTNSPIDNSSNEMYSSAVDELSEIDDSEFAEQERLFDKEERELKEQLEILEKSNKALRVQLLEMKVRMSLQGSKNELKSKASTPKATPKIGTKRKAHMAQEPNTSRKTENRNKPHTIPAPVNNFTYPFYQQLPTPSGLQQPYNPSPPTFLPSAPPPPPPATARPTTPPPPPPPVQPTTNYSRESLPRPRKHITQEVPDVESMKDSIEVQNVLKGVADLVSLRIFDDRKNRPTELVRFLPRPSRLITIDQYTMPMQMILLNERKDSSKWEPPSIQFTLPAGVPVEVSMHSSWYESPFFIMLRRKATAQPSNTVMAPIIDAIINTIPPTDDLSTVQIGNMYFVSLENTLQLVRSYVFQYPQNEFLAALKLELSFYVNGNTKSFKDDFNETSAVLPLCVDVEWQKIRAEVSFPSQLPLILELLHRISLLNTPFASKESATVSSMTAEVLIRLIRLDRLEQVLRLLTNFNDDIDSEKMIFDMDYTPGLYLQEQDKYLIWMLVLYYYVSKTLPEGVCNTWMNSLVKDGAPTKSLFLFMIDWTSSAFQSKFDRTTLFGITNILLSMLSHFGKKACNDVRRKPLLVGVLRTLFSFLSSDPSYKNPGTLLLVRGMTRIIDQIPEIQEIIIEYEIKAGTPVCNLVEYVYHSKQIMSPSNICSLSYHVARCFYETRKLSKRNLLVISNLLLYPLLDYDTKDIQREIMNKIAAPQSNEATVDLPEEKIILLVDTIRQKYLTAMGLDSLIGGQQTQQRHDKHEKMELYQTSFAWMNLLLLTVISKFLYRKTSIVRDNLDKYTNLIFEESMKKIRSNDGKLLMFKYKQQLM